MKNNLELKGGPADGLLIEGSKDAKMYVFAILNGKIIRDCYTNRKSNIKYFYDSKGKYMSQKSYKVGDIVYIDCIDNFGGEARIIEIRENLHSKYKVQMLDNNPETPFWAHDFEINEK